MKIEIELIKKIQTEENLDSKIKNLKKNPKGKLHQQKTLDG